jgi:flagellar motor switch/type III secretory pathway protein FliN
LKPTEELIREACEQQSVSFGLREQEFARTRIVDLEAREEKSMNKAIVTSTPMMDGNPVQGPQLVEKPQEPDLCELMPWLPCTLALDLPVVKFTVGDLLSLVSGSTVETAYHQSSDLPLRVNGQLVGWTEFEVVGERLAVRLTDLS